MEEFLPNCTSLVKVMCISQSAFYICSVWQHFIHLHWQLRKLHKYLLEKRFLICAFCVVLISITNLSSLCPVKVALIHKHIYFCISYL